VKYLQSQPFTVGGATKSYSDGWERIFGKKDEPELTPETPAETLRPEAPATEDAAIADQDNFSA